MADKEKMGDISIKNEVVATIASIAMSEVEGIVSISGKPYLDAQRAPKGPDKGVKVEVDGNRTSLVIDINVVYGHVIYDTAHRLQKHVKNAVESMTGMTVESLDVNVREVLFESKGRKSKSADDPAATGKGEK